MESVQSFTPGVKRSFDNDKPEAYPVKRIKALNQAVINKIAAGEIIVAPLNALKELVENAVDAGSTNLDITVKDGGMKLLQISDNGNGIHHGDLSILCERFTTSKLKSFEDLSQIATYGFRGEALASISHIAHLTVTTRTSDSSCAWRAKYENGKLVPIKPGQSTDPKPIAGRKGTQLVVEDLFYNMPQRQKAFKSPSEEYAKILDMVGRYAVHCWGVSFSCKKHGDASMSIAVSQQTTTIDRVRQIYGSNVASDLLPFEASSDEYGFRTKGLMSNANHHGKKTVLLLFINNRAVESSSIRSALQRTYAPWLPKGCHPFVYLALTIAPGRLDVNIHPTKREVNFLHEEAIIEIICEHVREELGRVDTSRSFLTQSLLPNTKLSQPNHESISSRQSDFGEATKLAENNMIRTDPSLRKITSMLPTTATHPSAPLSYRSADKPHIQVRLTSVKELRSAVRECVHGELTEVFSTHTFVGVVDTARRIAAIQSGVKLYLIDYALACHDLFYQIGLTDFGNIGSIELAEPLKIVDLVSLAVAVEDDKAYPSDTPRLISELLIEKRSMLSEYFSLNITEDGRLQTIPLLVKGFVPTLSKLPQFLLRLGPCVDWHNEKQCFHNFLMELASFYVPERIPHTLEQRAETTPRAERKDMASQETQSRREQICHSLEHVLFPAFRIRLVATKGLLQGVVEVANLKGLYRVFERC